MRKAQSAMEYLMTYGWSILIIAVVLGILFQLGVFNSSSFSVRAPPGTCQLIKTSTLNLVGQCSGILPQYAAKFDGQTSYVDTGTGPSMNFYGFNAMTVSLWVNPTLQTGNCCPSVVVKQIWNSGSDNAGFYMRLYDSGLVEFSIENNGGSSASASGIAANQWWHLVGTYDGSNIRLYKNGALQGNTPWLNGMKQSTGVSMKIGGYDWAFKGIISNVQTYNTSLSANDVSDLYNEGLGGAPIKLQNLVGWWPLNGNSKDYSGNINNGAPVATSYTSQYGK
jgi:hypothetical protein